VRATTASERCGKTAERTLGARFPGTSLVGEPPEEIEL
jgi:hypothetical protein